jgi:hypothetical protein
VAGRKQHYIPQFLLRGFGVKGAGSATQITVYNKERGIYVTATEGSASQRDFYSAPASGAGDITLDDKITEYEFAILPILERCRNAEAHHIVKPREASELVAHLCVRQAHIRQTFEEGIGLIAEKLEEKLSDPSVLRRYFKIDEPVQSEEFQKLVHESYLENHVIFGIRGISEQQFESALLQIARTHWDDLFRGNNFFMAMIAKKMEDAAKDLAKISHTKALEKTLAPQPRISDLQKLSWKIHRVVDQDMVLPDCVAISVLKGNDCLPLMYAGFEEIQAVIMPVSRDRILSGTKMRKFSIPYQNLTEYFVKCSWDSFYAANRSPKLEILMPQTGSRARTFLKNSILDGTLFLESS